MNKFQKNIIRHDLEKNGIYFFIISNQNKLNMEFLHYLSPKRVSKGFENKNKNDIPTFVIHFSHLDNEQYFFFEICS